MSSTEERTSLTESRAGWREPEYRCWRAAVADLAARFGQPAEVVESALISRDEAVARYAEPEGEAVRLLSPDEVPVDYEMLLSMGYARTARPAALVARILSDQRAPFVIFLGAEVARRRLADLAEIEAYRRSSSMERED